MPTDLRGLAIAITGASSGIGRATALACAQAGMPVALGARRVDRLNALAAEIRDLGGRAWVQACDVSHREDCERFITGATAEFGSLYAVFANAGYGFESPVMELTDEQIDASLRTNFWGSLWTIRPAVEQMLQAGRGHVIWCSSCLSKIGLPNYAAYSASKALQDHFGRAMRIELASKGIFVSTVHPVGTDTEFFDRAAESSGGKRRTITTPERMRQSPEVVAKAILASLRRPRGEIWTSFSMRLMMGLGTIWPEFLDRVLRKRMKAKGLT